MFALLELFLEVFLLGLKLGLYFKLSVYRIIDPRFELGFLLFFLSTNARRDIYPRISERLRLMIRHTLQEVIRILVYSSSG